MKKIIILLTAIALGVLGWYYWRDRVQPLRQATGVQEIQSIADFETFLGGGTPVVAKFYADWCGPCKRMKPIFERAAKKYANKIVFVALNVDKKELKPLVSKHASRGFPTFVYFRKDGTVVNNRPGSQSEQDFNLAVQQLLQ